MRLLSSVRLWISLFACVSTLAALPGAADPPLMSIDDVRPGQRGVWYTVVEGVEIRAFELELIGLAPHFAGPREPVVLARVLDPENILSGPVAGMSGSPVYIDGRLLGAYAYGYTWPKEQGIIGITPVERMQGLLDDLTGSPRPPGQPPVMPLPGGDGAPQLTPLPTPLQLGGFSGHSLALVRDRWQALGVEPTLAPLGEASLPDDWQLAAGAAIAAVLMSGDFNVAATGTVTWTDGQRVLAFGHPFLRLGNASLPFAGAHIHTVVRNIRQSFKLSRTGPLIGTLQVDRLPGVAGEIGPLPPLADLSLTIEHPRGTRVFTSRLTPHARLFPLLAAMAVMEGVTQTIEASAEQTLRLEVGLATAELEPLHWIHAASGPTSAGAIGLDFLLRVEELLQNPFAEVAPTRIDLHVRVADAWDTSRLREAWLEHDRVRPGETLTVVCELDRYRQPARVERVELTIPETIPPGSQLRVIVADAATADRLAGSRRPVYSLDELAGRLRARRDPESLYVLLVETRPGWKLGAAELPALPPSARLTLAGSGAGLERHPLDTRVWSEIRVPVGSVVSGQARLDISWEQRPEGAQR